MNYGARYYVLDHVTGGYGGGVSATALPAELRDRQPALPRHKKGGAPIMAPTVMDRWGAVAEHKVAVMGTHLTRYAPQDATLFLKACPMRDTPLNTMHELTSGSTSLAEKLRPNCWIG